ncbi:MAG: hypothetical protein NW206_16640 [Hyphomonadaceae bacterium]|nr:hypothetical protein [Hyphomonadaceae bacterium]
MKPVLILVLAALAASCATALPQVVPNSDGSFAVRFDQNVVTLDQVDAQARIHCNGAIAQFVAQETRFDGFAYRTYRCPAGGS